MKRGIITYILIIILILGIKTVFSQEVGVSSIIITFESAPTVTVTKTPLKYNKDFALGFHIEDGKKDVFTHAFQYLNGGTIDNIVYPGLKFTDGCGNDVPFKMSASVFSFNNNQDLDLHNPNGVNASTYLTWPEIDQLYKSGWGIYNQGLTSASTGDKDYLIKRNASYIKYKTLGATNGGIDMKVFVNPQGDAGFSSPAFQQGYIAAYRPYVYGVPNLNVSNATTITDIDSLKMGRTNLAGLESLGALADSLNANSSSSIKRWSSSFNKSITGGDGYSFDVFKFYMNYIATNYGKAGSDNIWMASEEETLQYLTINKKVTVNSEILGNQLLITFSGDIPTDFRYYALSLVISSNVKITDIDINGGGGILLSE